MKKDTKCQHLDFTGIHTHTYTCISYIIELKQNKLIFKLWRLGSLMYQIARMTLPLPGLLSSAPGNCVVLKKNPLLQPLHFLNEIILLSSDHQASLPLLLISSNCLSQKLHHETMRGGNISPIIHTINISHLFSRDNLLF